MKKILTLVLFTITIILDGHADIIKLSKEYEKNSTSYTINAHYNKLRDYNNSNWPYDRKSVNLASIKVEKGEELTFKNAHILSNISAKFVRTLLIGLLFFTSIKLIIRGAETIFGFNFPIL